MSFSNGTLEEHEPLLPSDRPLPAKATSKPKFRIVWCCMVVEILIAMYYAFSEAPLYRLYESVICEDYYSAHDPLVIEPGGGVPEEKCKLDPVQMDLTIIQSNQALFNLISCTSTLSTLCFVLTDLD